MSDQRRQSKRAAARRTSPPEGPPKPASPKKSRVRQSSGSASQARLTQAEADHTLPRKQGGQPQNHNAIKHGLYSAAFKKRERKHLDQLPEIDLTGEIELIRVTSARFLQDIVPAKGAGDLQGALTALRAINLSAQSIAKLLRAQVLAQALTRDDFDALALDPSLSFPFDTS